MKLRIVSFVAAVLALSECLAIDPKYPASLISAELKKDSYAVIREQVFDFKIVARNKSKTYYRQVATILNSNGQRLAMMTIPYDRNTKVSSIRGTVYDGNGYITKKLKSSEIYDHGYFDGYTLYSDNRYKRIDLTQNEYPYTVELEFEIESNILYYIPSFELYDDDEVGIERTSYSITYPPDLKPRYHLLNAKEPKTQKIEAYEMLSWTFENIKPNRWEKFCPDVGRFVPTVMAAPSQFEFEGHVGDMSSWQSYGKWIWSLNKDRDKLSQTTIEKLRSMTDGKSNVEKVRILYDYLQQKTRYVSVQVGIGGLQPFEARVVDEVGYGDCKALSNYMVAMLKSVGIKSHYTIVMAGDDAKEVVPEFPSHQANHAIVAVPMEEDTIWLECTSRYSPFGHIGTFTGDRFVLLIDENGGKLVRTPPYEKTKNLTVRHATVTLDTSGNGRAKVSTSYFGNEIDEQGGVHQYALLSHDVQKKWIQKNTQLPSFDVVSFAFKNTGSAATIVDMELELPNAAVVTGKRLFFPPNLMNKVQGIAEEARPRTLEIFFRYPYTHIDTISYFYPDNIHPEFVPPTVRHTSRFGDYEASFVLEPDRLVYVRKFSINKGFFPRESYPELVRFYREVNKADNIKLVFLKKT
jgi:hypothetical protein